jgi:hypothetical protein
LHFALVIANIVALVSAQVKACHNPARSVHNLNIHSKDRGCTAPGCDVPAYFTEVHHVTDYAKCRTTDVNDLTLACGTNHRIVRPGGWQTRKRKDGLTEWIPPPHLDRGQPRINLFHHPEELLREDDEDDEEDDP